ncbi:hypothetical protein K491DRAFT_348977 [Lophiostoma macrostomum CBS 122681]|uniref:Uncharacterized protein n=1 Tax=Lophiostoma macrostomum CBS 122681 TaxID=1314788 RepID=A0A6A6TBB2_9PLEO|nr:hypothetical protein K491DRAFT_348977 [Lophiostoma macrostomum CBS 122681]
MTSVRGRGIVEFTGPTSGPWDRVDSLTCFTSILVGSAVGQFLAEGERRAVRQARVRLLPRAPQTASASTTGGRCLGKQCWRRPQQPDQPISSSCRRWQRLKITMFRDERHTRLIRKPLAWSCPPALALDAARREAKNNLPPRQRRLDARKHTRTPPRMWLKQAAPASAIAVAIAIARAAAASGQAGVKSRLLYPWPSTLETSAALIAHGQGSVGSPSRPAAKNSRAARPLCPAPADSLLRWRQTFPSVSRLAAVLALDLETTVL